ncbi:hypothetical protein [Thalassobacillus sp. C254]|uniref:hypothetical protein n=1 Tax=Thalassobacillus sp. C254 TaxID=1225341 RepID=UPI0006D187AB|nr:hypothetical protein [Thalassobacillus sp. C254]
MARTRLRVIHGKSGVVSERIKRRRLYNWKDLNRRYSNVFSKLEHPYLLLKMFIFDVWLVNIDRNNRNIILYRKKNSRKYKFYLIDHGLTGFGSFTWKHVNWDSSYWEDIKRYNNHYLTGLRRYIKKHQKKLWSYVREIQSFPDLKVSQIITKIPSDLLTEHQKNILITFLVQRKHRLHTIIERFVR